MPETRNKKSFTRVILYGKLTTHHKRNNYSVKQNVCLNDALLGESIQRLSLECIPRQFLQYRSLGGCTQRFHPIGIDTVKSSKPHVTRHVLERLLRMTQ